MANEVLSTQQKTNKKNPVSANNLLSFACAVVWIYAIETKPLGVKPIWLIQPYLSLSLSKKKKKTNFKNQRLLL